MSPSFRSRSLFIFQSVLVFGLYFFTARWGLELSAVNAFAAFIWPPTGIALAALFIFGYRFAPSIIAAAFLVNYLAGAPIYAAVLIAVGNTLEGLVGAWLLHTFRFNFLFNRLIDSFIFIAVVLSATVISATIGVSALATTSLLNISEIPVTWLAWWVGDVLGALILGPFLIRWLGRSPLISYRTRRQFFETLSFLAVLAVFSVFVFWDPIPALSDAIPAYLLFVPLTWGALRVGPRVMTLALATVAAVAAIGTFGGTGPFAPITNPSDLFELQLFLSTVSFIFLLFVAAIEERKESWRRLEERVVSLREDMEIISEADRAKNDFIATLSHELRNPLAPILSTLEIMRARFAKDRDERTKDLQALVETTHENVIRMTRLLDDLLDVARISRKKITLQMSEVHLTDVLAHSREMAESLVTKHKHELVIEAPREDIKLRADQLRIEQIVVNLLNNAAKYTPAGGKILLSASRARNGVEIRVRDNGMGIPLQELERIFEPFKQINEGDKPESSGLGIGLSLAKRLVELHGGTIEAKSEGLGKGSEFIVWLPVANDVIELPASIPNLPRIMDEPARTFKKKVLVVDDNVAAADALSNLLNHSGHVAQTANDGASALETLASFSPDIILLDIGLPDRSGYDLAQTIRQYLDPCPTLVALTGYGQEEDRQRSHDAGFDHHLTKPVSIADLEKVLA